MGSDELRDPELLALYREAPSVEYPAALERRVLELAKQDLWAQQRGGRLNRWLVGWRLTLAFASTAAISAIATFWIIYATLIGNVGIAPDQSAAAPLGEGSRIPDHVAMAPEIAAAAAPQGAKAPEIAKAPEMERLPEPAAKAPEPPKAEAPPVTPPAPPPAATAAPKPRPRPAPPSMPGSASPMPRPAPLSSEDEPSIVDWTLGRPFYLWAVGIVIVIAVAGYRWRIRSQRPRRSGKRS